MQLRHLSSPTLLLICTLLIHLSHHFFIIHAARNDINPFTSRPMYATSRALPATPSKPVYPHKVANWLSTLKAYDVVTVQSAHLPSAHAFPLQSYAFGNHLQNRVHGEKARQHPSQNEIILQVQGKSVHVELIKNEGLFHADYSETSVSYDDHGNRLEHLDQTITLKDQQVEHCYYQGRINGNDKLLIAVNTCHFGFSGMLEIDNEMYSIEPAHIHMDTAAFHAHAKTMSNPYALHILTHTSNVPTQTFTCGNGIVDVDPTVSTSSAPDASHTHDHDHVQQHASSSLASSLRDTLAHLDHNLNTPSASSSSAKPMNTLATTSKTQKYVEWLVVNDYERYVAKGKDKTVTFTSSANVANYVNTLYVKTSFTPPIQVILIGQLVWDTKDPYQVTKGTCSACASDEVDVGALLSLFHSWRLVSGNTKPYLEYDNAQLFSGLNFQATVLGYAGVGSMCTTTQSGGICQLSSSDDFDSTISAHEMGHNFGMQHDDPNINTCPESGYIMNAVVSLSNAPKDFSSCSLTYLSSYMTTDITCADNVPTSKWGTAVCGNGFVEDGEQCDCGSSDCSKTSDTCCNGATCKFIGNATCSNNNPCCSGCQLISAASKTVCRDSASVCDLAETCSGTSQYCPADYKLGTGTECKQGTYEIGYCYNGYCSSQTRACRETGANVQGGPFDSCPEQEYLNGGNTCGTLYCANNPNQCTYFTISKQIAYVPDGMPCGTNMQCLNQQCQSSASINSGFVWTYSEYTDCTSCDQIQYRNRTCTSVADKATVADDYCTPSGAEATSQTCINYEIGCTPKDTSSSSNGIDVFGYSLARNTVLFASLGAVSLFFVILACCYQAVTHGAPDELPRPKSPEA